MHARAGHDATAKARRANKRRMADTPKFNISLIAGGPCVNGRRFALDSPNPLESANLRRSYPVRTPTPPTLPESPHVRPPPVATVPPFVGVSPGLDQGRRQRRGQPALAD